MKVEWSAAHGVRMGGEVISWIALDNMAYALVKSISNTDGRIIIVPVNTYKLWVVEDE